MTIPITWVDAFSDVAFGGNPAAVCLLRQPLDDGRMQSIAFELGIAETAYLTPRTTRPPSACAGSRPPSRSTFAATPRGLGACAARGGHRRRHRPVDLSHPQRPAARRLRRRHHRARFPAEPVVPAPLPDSLQEQWPGAVVASGRTGFFTFVVLASAEAVRAYQPDLAAIAATGAKALLLTAAAAPGSGPTTSCVSSAQRGHRRGPGHGSGPVLRRPLLGVRAGTRQPCRPSALTARRHAVRTTRRREGPHRGARHHGAQR